MLCKTEAFGLLDSSIREIRELLPAIDVLLSRHRATTLGDYVQQLCSPPAPGYQCHRDFVAEMANYTRETLGDATAERIADDLDELPQVLTANHHGIDSFAQSTQSNLLFSMRRRASGKPFQSIPVLACASVPLNNLTYPRGLLIYGGANPDGACGIRRLPLFPDSQKRKLVSAAGSFSAEMVNRARNRARKMCADGSLTRQLDGALDKIFDELAGVCQEFPDYSRQATVVNNRIWRRLFPEPGPTSELVYVELERVASRLLEKDLFDDTSICHQLLFDPNLRGRLIDRLDGQRACWQVGKLLRRGAKLSAVDPAEKADSSSGTMFFWGVDARGRQVPLAIDEGRVGAPVLRGIDGRGGEWMIPFTAPEIARALGDGELLPSIFTSYLLLSIARGVHCVGGYYQADYLPIMREAVVDILGDASAGPDAGASGPKAGTRSDFYLSGMQAIGLVSDDRLLPAGPVEILAAGGIDADRYDRIGGITVLDAHIASLYDTLMDVAPGNAGFQRAKSDLSRLVRDSVGDKIVSVSIG